MRSKPPLTSFDVSPFSLFKSVAGDFCKRILALMASRPPESEQSPAAETPLLDSNQHQERPTPENNTGGGGEDDDDDLDRTLRWLETFLTLLGFNQSSIRSLVLSWLVFLAIGLVLPVTVLELGHCLGCERYQYKSFELNIVVSQACLAAVSLLCVSHNLRKHGIRKFLFVDQLSGRMGRLKALYIQQISVILPLFFHFRLKYCTISYSASSMCNNHQFLNVF